MSGVAVVTDSASDLTTAQAAAGHVTLVPLLAYFGEKEYRAGVDMSAEDFWTELTRPGAPFPRTAAASPGTFHETFEKLFADGADEIVCVSVGSKLSATIKSAQVAADMLAGRKIRIVDTETASLGQGVLALTAGAMAAVGASAAEIVDNIERRRAGVRLYIVLDTLEYLKRGGRISGAQAAIGSVLAVKPIITIKHGVVETADRPRTRTKARARLLELFDGVKQPERVAILDCRAPEVDSFADDLAAQLKFPREEMTLNLVGPSVGPHVGPGAYGAVVLPRLAP
jgi:fatty acid kinase fatty acid binding subunit